MRLILVSGYTVAMCLISITPPPINKKLAYIFGKVQEKLEGVY